MNPDLVLAQVAGAPGPPSFLPFLVMGSIFGIFYFLLIRPQQKRDQERVALQDGLKKNDEVVTSGGIHGRVVETKDSIVVLEIAQNTRIRVEKRSIDGPARPSKVATKGAGKASKDTKDATG